MSIRRGVWSLIWTAGRFRAVVLQTIGVGTAGFSGQWWPRWGVMPTTVLKAIFQKSPYSHSPLAGRASRRETQLSQTPSDLLGQSLPQLHDTNLKPQSQSPLPWFCTLEECVPVWVSWAHLLYLFLASRQPSIHEVPKSNGPFLAADPLKP